MQQEQAKDMSPPSRIIVVDGVNYDVTKKAPGRYDVHRGGTRLGEFAWMPKAGVHLVVDDGPIAHLQAVAQAFVEEPAR